MFPPDAQQAIKQIRAACGMPITGPPWLESQRCDELQADREMLAMLAAEEAYIAAAKAAEAALEALEALL